MNNLAELVVEAPLDDAAPWTRKRDLPGFQTYTDASKRRENLKWGGYPRLLSVVSKDDAIRARQRAAEREFKNVERTILQSRYILDLQDDWDEAGSLSFDKEVWEKATHFARRVADWGNRSKRTTLGALSIAPAHSGSIDLYWENSFCDLLLNAPKVSSFGTFYGKNRRGEIFSGSVELVDSCPDLIVGWLRKKTC
jgi:hypothetical protein